MPSSPRTWRWLVCVSLLLLLVAQFRLHLHTGYPKEWAKVQVGMATTQVRALCGEPTHSSGMGPDIWEAQFLFGKWAMMMDCGEYHASPTSIVTFVVITYEHPLAWSTLVLRSEIPPIQDYAAFLHAFGVKTDPGTQYRVVRPQSPAR